MKKNILSLFVSVAVLLSLSSSITFARETTEKLKSMAIAGDTTAMVVLGGRFQYAEGEAKNYVEAARWYRMAAVKRDFDGAYGMGSISVDQKDYVTAYSWFALYAAEQGSLREARDDVYSLLSTDKKAKALESAAKLKDTVAKEQGEMLRRYIEQSKNK